MLSALTRAWKFFPAGRRVWAGAGLLAAAIAGQTAVAADWPLTGALGAHDPSIIKEGQTWWCFTTGFGLPVKFSADGLAWQQGVALFNAELPWWRTYAPNMDVLDVWAPDIQKFNNRYWCYYAVSQFGTNNSAIGLKSCTSIAAGDWRDDGFVIGSKSGVDAYNAIDPNLTTDDAGNPWLVFGSWFDGLQLVRLDPATMKPTGAIQRIAKRANGIEGANIVSANGYYYLFASIDLCCQGVNSSYKITYGRAHDITGPYVDKDGAALLNGAGTLLEIGGPRWKGPGGQDVYLNGSDWVIARHAYDANNNGAPILRISDLYWDADGWPTFTSTPTVTPDLPVTTVAGQAGSSGINDGTGAAARFHSPVGVAVDNAGNLYVADADNHAIRKIAPATGAVTTLAGLAGTSGSVDGTGSAARFNSPSDVTVDASGNVYVADTLNHTVRRITPAGAVTTVAGTAGASGSADGTGAAARFNALQGVALDAAGNLYVADTNNDTVRKVVLSTSAVTTVAGLAGSPGSVDGNGSAARFNGPSGVAFGPAGELYVVDTGNHTIRVMNTAGLVGLVAGSAGTSGGTDGTGAAARFNFPSAVALDSAGNLYVADTYNHLIRKIVRSTGAVTTVAGQAGANGSADGLGSAARFSFPAGLTADAAGNLYVADTGNHTIRLGLLPLGPAIQTQPQSQSAAAGSSVQFSVTASGRPSPTYQWYLNNAIITGATGSSYGLSNVQSTNAGDYTVVVANPTGSVTSSKATLTITTVTTPPPSTPSGGSSGGGGGGATEPGLIAALALLAAARWMAASLRRKNQAPAFPA